MLQSWKIFRRVLLILAVVMTVIAACYFSRRAQYENDRAEFAKRMVFILSLLKEYEDANGRALNAEMKDENGVPIASWRFLITKQLNLTDIDSGQRADWEGKWDSPANAWWAHKVADMYCLDSELETSVLGITGPNTVLDGTSCRTLSEVDPDTIVIIEVTHSGIHWMEPGDITKDEISHWDGQVGSRNFSDGLHIGFADGEVWYVSRHTPVSAIAKFATIDAARKHERLDVLGPYVLSTSK